MSLLSFLGPFGWIADALGAVADFCVKHWKAVVIAVAVAVVLGFTFNKGVQYERGKWTKKETVRLAKEKADEEQRIRTNHDLQIAYEHIDAQASQDKAKREIAYQQLEEKVKAYVARTRGVSCGIGDDGMQLLRDAVRARHLGDQRH